MWLAILLSNTYFSKYTDKSVRSVSEGVEKCEEERKTERNAAGKRSEDEREEDREANEKNKK